jgi:putative phosphoribosyl transferase
MHVKVAETLLEGSWDSPPKAWGVVLFPHGRGTGRGVNDGFLASRLRKAGLATLLLNLLTTEEADLDARKAAFRFDMELLAGRLAGATDWLADQPAMRGLPIGYFGVGYTAAAALLAASKRPNLVRAVVTHDALTELADRALPRVPAPTLLIGGSGQSNSEQSGAKDKQFVVVPSIVATHKPEEVARLATEWFIKHLSDGRPTP